MGNGKPPGLPALLNKYVAGIADYTVPISHFP